MLFVSIYVKSVGWYVIVQVLVSELYIEMNSVSVLMIIWFIIIVFGFVLLGVWFVGSISKLLENLVSVFIQLGNGQGDLMMCILLFEQKEICKLVEGFNQFIVSLYGILINVVVISVQICQFVVQVVE